MTLLTYGIVSTIFKPILLLEIPCNRDRSGNPFCQKRLKRIARRERLEKEGEGIAQISAQKNLPKIREVPIAN